MIGALALLEYVLPPDFGVMGRAFRVVLPRPDNGLLPRLAAGLLNFEEGGVSAFRGGIPERVGDVATPIETIWNKTWKKGNITYHITIKPRNNQVPLLLWSLVPEIWLMVFFNILHSTV